MAHRNYFAVLPLDPQQDPTNGSITANGSSANVALTNGASTDVASTNGASTSFAPDLRARFSRLQATEDAKDTLIEVCREDRVMAFAHD